MQVFIQLKEYEAYFERLIVEKKYNEVENLIHYLKENHELELEFKRVLRTEKNFINILFFIQAFWNYCIKSRKNSYDNNGFNILLDIFNTFLKENSYFQKISNKQPCLLNLINLISIKYAKMYNNFDKVRPIIDLIIKKFSDKINRRLLCESLRNEGFLNESVYYSSVLNLQLNFGMTAEMNEIEKILGNMNLQLIELKEKDIFNIDNNIIENGKTKKDEMNNNQMMLPFNNTFLNNISDTNNLFWDIPLFLNNKRSLTINDSNNDPDRFTLKHNLFLDTSNSHKINPKTNNIVDPSIINDKSHLCPTKLINFGNAYNDRNCFDFNKKQFSSGFNLSENNFYFDQISQMIEPIRLPTQINIRDVTKIPIEFKEKARLAIYQGKEMEFFTLRTNYPISSVIGIYYFEVEIVNIVDDVIGIGLVNKDTVVASKIPGWESNSIGYHSDDGNIFISKTQGEKYGPTFSNKDIIGCCIDYLNKISFFTKNGVKLKTVEFYSSEELFPAVSFRKKDQSIRINFGDSQFIYNIREYIKEEKDKISTEISKLDMDFEKMNINLRNSINNSYDFKEDAYKLITDYLIYNGYEETYKELNSTKKTEFYSSEGIEERNSIRKFLKQYNFKAVKKILEEKFKNENSYPIEIITICESIYEMIDTLKKPFSKSSDILYTIQNLKSNNKYFFDIYENFSELKIGLENILEALLLDDKKEIITMIERILSTHLSAENIFEFVNKQILEANFRVGFNELDIIFKHSCVMLKEGLKNKQQHINFILREENFINNVNKIIIQNPLQTIAESDLPNRIIYPPNIQNLMID